MDYPGNPSLTLSVIKATIERKLRLESVILA